MKRTTMLVLAAVAALACTAFAGVSPAFASKTVLCKASGSSCTAGNVYPSGTALKASSSNVSIVTNLGTANCSESSLEGKTNSAEADPLPGELTTWTLGGCKLGGTSCTATGENLPYSASVAASEGGNGSMALHGSGGEVSWNFTCGVIVKCKLSFEPTLTVEGGNPAHLSASQTMKKTGSLCPKEAKFTASYSVTSPQPAYVLPPTPVGTTLCKKNTTPCLGSDLYPAHTKLEAALVAATNLKVETNLGSWECSSSSLGGETLADSGSPLSATVSPISVGGCTNKAFGACSVVSENEPHLASFEVAAESGARTMTINSLKLHMTCGASFNCTFSSTAAEFTVVGGTPATLEINQNMNRTGTLCPSTAILNARYQLTSPSPLYLIRN